MTVRHYTSRAGDPHRHLHLQINARVFAAGKWRGLHTVGVRDFLAAINGIGHAAVACDPQFRAALAAHGYTLDADWRNTASSPTTSVRSARGRRRSRATSTATNASGRAAHPGEHPGPALRRAWDAPGVGRGPPGQGRSPARGRPRGSGGGPSWPAWATATRPARSRLTPDPGRRAGPGRCGRAGADPAGRRPLGVERRGHPR